MTASPDVWDGERGWQPPPPAASCPTAASIRRRKQRWIWSGRIATGAATVLGGRGGIGKSTIAAAVAAHVTGGPALWGHDGPRVRGSVLWLPAEESVATITVPRLRAAGAKMRQVFFPGLNSQGYTERVIEIPQGLGELEVLCLRHGASLIVVDPLASYVNGVDLNRQQDVRLVYQAMRLVSERTGVAWLLVCHPSKVRTGPLIDRLFGSAAIGHCARSVLIVGRHPDGTERRTVVHDKTNDGEPCPSVDYHIEGHEKYGTGVIRWEGPSTVTSEQLGIESLDAGELDAHADARRLLTQLLGDGPRPAKEVLQEGAACGIGERTLRAAKAELRIPSRRIADGYGDPHWEWGPLAKEGDDS